MTPDDELSAWIARKFSEAHGASARAILSATLRDGDRSDAELMVYAQQYKMRRGCYVGETWVQYRGGKSL